MSGTPMQSTSSMSYPPNDGSGTETQTMHQTPAFFLANYRLGKTLGNGSFGKVILANLQRSYSLAARDLSLTILRRAGQDC